MSFDEGTDECAALLKAAPDTEFMEALAPDMNGMLRGKRIRPAEFDKPFDEGINFCACSVVLNSKGERYESVVYGGEDGDPDVIGRAVPGSLSQVPWSLQPTAQVLLELSEHDGRPFFLDPRNVLRAATAPLTDLGLHPVVAIELEFYLVEHDGNEFRPRTACIPGSELPQDGRQYASLDDLIDVDPFLTDLAQICEVQNIPAGAASSEYAPGQFEVNLNHVGDPALACDHAVLLKRAVKAAAHKNGLAATFMAKPFAEFAGSGMHVHVSVLDDGGVNVFAGESTDGAFSDTMRHAVGGMVAMMDESMAILAPNANSYRRFAKHSYAPTAPNWGLNNRDTAIRIPLSSPENTRIEDRVAGADANPYLVVASILAGIHHGVSRKINPGVMVKERQQVEEEIALPVRWDLALDAFDEGEHLRRYLGEEYYRVFAACRRDECERFHAQITNRDYEWYLRAV